MTDNEYLEVIKKAVKEEDKWLIRKIKNLLDKHYIPDNKEVFVVEKAITEFKFDEFKSERKCYYYICKTEEAVEKLIKSLQNVESEVRVFKGISKNKIKELEEMKYDSRNKNRRG